MPPSTTKRQTRPLRPRCRRRQLMKLQMVPMIDVVFLLLIFFLVSAHFRPREGYLPAQLPQAAAVQPIELEPLALVLHSAPDGACQIQIGTTLVVTITSCVTDPAVNTCADFRQFADILLTEINRQGRTTRDPIKLIPTGQSSWEHVVRAYDALSQLQLHDIIFAVVDESP